MKRKHEQLLVAALAGFIILSGAVFAVQPALADDQAPAGKCNLPPAVMQNVADTTAPRPDRKDAVPANDLGDILNANPDSGLCLMSNPEPLVAGPRTAFGAA